MERRISLPQNQRMTKAEKIKQNERIRKRYANFFRPKIKEAFRDQIGKYVSSLKENGVQGVFNQIPDLIDPGFTAIMQQIYIRAGIARADLTLRSLRRLPKVEKKKGSLGFNAQWTNDILNYFRLNLFNKVVLPIASTTQDHIRIVLDRGIAEGWTLDEMISEIVKVDYINGRTERILRTEITRAINYGNELAARAYEFRTMKRWISVHDDRTRHPHLIADGQTVDIDSSFSVNGESLDFPGDPNGSAENTINCRCFSEIVPIRNSAGRLIPKDPEPVRVQGRLRQDIQDILRDLNN